MSHPLDLSEPIEITEGTPTADSIMPSFGITFPLPEFSHRAFMEERNQSGWLSWQRTRPTSLPRGKPR